MSENYCVSIELSVFSINHGERSDIDNLFGNQKHKSVVAAMSSSRVTHFFKASDKSLILAAKEATSVHHAAIHGQSFESSDCTSKLVLKYLNLNLPLQEQNVNHQAKY